MGWVRPDPTIWARPSKVGWVNYDLLDLSSLFFSFSFLHWAGWTRSNHLGWAGKGLAQPMLVAFFHLNAKSLLYANGYEGVLEKKNERKTCLAEEEKRLAAFLVVQGRLTCGLVGGGNGDKDVVVTVAQKRLAKGEKKKLGKCFFSQL